MDTQFETNAHEDEIGYIDFIVVEAGEFAELLRNIENLVCDVLLSRDVVFDLDVFVKAVGAEYASIMRCKNAFTLDIAAHEEFTEAMAHISNIMPEAISRHHLDAETLNELFSEGNDNKFFHSIDDDSHGAFCLRFTEAIHNLTIMFMQNYDCIMAIRTNGANMANVITLH